MNIRYVDVISNSLTELNTLCYKLGGNRITEKGADKLLGTINKFAKEIDLSKNKIGSLGCE